jgi:trigger factor
MNYTVNAEKAKLIITLTVENKVLVEEVEKSYQEISSKVQIKGYRAGKAPREVFEKQEGMHKVYTSAQDEIVNKAYNEFLKKDGLKYKIFGSPSLTNVEFDLEKDFDFTIEVAILPEVELGEYTKQGVTIEEKIVTAEDIEKEVESKLAASTVLEVVECEAQNGDTVVIDYEGFVNGEAFEGGKGANHPLEIGSNSFIPGFEEQLVGTKANDQKDVQVTFPAEYHAENLAGKEAIFKCHVHEVKSKKEQVLNDEFVASQNIENVATVDQYRVHLKEVLEVQAKKENQTKLREAIINKAIENANVELPEALVNEETNNMYKHQEQQMTQQGFTMEMFMQFTGKTKEDIMKDMQEMASKQLKQTLVLTKIAEIEKVEVTAEDFQKEVAEIVKMHNMEEEKVLEILNQQRADVDFEIKMRKVVDFLVSSN